MSETTQPKRTVAVGFKNLHYAKLTKDDETGVTYGEVKKIAGAITGRVTPNVNSETLYADDMPFVIVDELGVIDVEFNIADFPLEVQADILGKTINDDGVLIDSDTDKAPEVALGFERETHAKTSRLTWLLKGTFREPTEEAQTKSGTPQFQTPTIAGTFVKRIHDGRWRYRSDSGMANVDPDVIKDWFNEVYEPVPVG